MVGARRANKKAPNMKILRRSLLILLLLFIVGWCVLWFAGSYVIKSKVTPRLTSIDAEGLQYRADSYGVGGFPFYYRIKPKNPQLSSLSDGETLFQTTDGLTAQVSLPGSAWGLITGGPIGTRINVAGTHKLPNGLSLEIDSGWMSNEIVNLRNLSADPDWIYDGLNLDLRGVTISSDGTPQAKLDRMTLRMDLLGDEIGYAFDFKVSNLSPAQPLFQQVPDTVDGIQLIGEVHPEVNSALMRFVMAVQDDPLTAFIDHGEAFGKVMASRPGLFIQDGTITWGEAQLALALNLEPHVNIGSMSGGLRVDGTLAGTSLMSLTQKLFREPAARSTDLGFLINGFMAISRSYNLDLENGQPYPIEGFLISGDRGGMSVTPEAVTINGKPLPAL